MAEIGKLYILAKDPDIASYAMSDTYVLKERKLTDWIRAEAFETPFMIIEEYGAEDCYWIKVLLGDKTGWINIYEEQLRLVKPYR
jgi:hypothetical protein